MSAPSDGHGALLAQFKDIAKVQDDELAQQVLQSVDWDVNAALSVLYDKQTPAPMEQMTVDDSAHARGPTFASQIGLNPWRAFAFKPWQILLLPLHFAAALLTSVLGLVARLLRIRPNLPSFSLRFPSPPTIRLDPYSCSERLVRELEEESGVSRASFGSASGVASSSSAVHPVASTSKSLGPSNAPKLPSFHIGSYESALRLAKEQIRPLCVILISSEHQDTDQFKRTVLRDADLIKTLSARNFVVWIGDTKYADPYHTACTLEATAFPFLALITLQPPRPGAHSSSPAMSVFSRLEGSPFTLTSANAIVSHINSVFIPRTSSYLDRLRREKISREYERQLRLEQDQAYEEAGRRDLERIRAKEAEVEAARLEAARKAQEEQQKAHQAQQAEAWRAWAKTHLVPPEAAGSPSTRLGVKLPSGQRITRKFPPTATLQQVYAWVECEVFPPTTDAAEPPVGYVHVHPFTLVTTFPKKILSHDALPQTLEEIGGLVPDASILVEGLMQSDSDEELESDED